MDFYIAYENFHPIETDSLYFFVLYYHQKILLPHSPTLSCFYIAKKNSNILHWVESIFFLQLEK